MLRAQINLRFLTCSNGSIIETCDEQLVGSKIGTRVSERGGRTVACNVKTVGNRTFTVDNRVDVKLSKKRTTFSSKSTFARPACKKSNPRIKLKPTSGNIKTSQGKPKPDMLISLIHISEPTRLL